MEISEAEFRRAVQRARIETAELLGWSTFGTHIDQEVELEFRGEDPYDGLPLWERVVGKEEYGN